MKTASVSPPRHLALYAAGALLLIGLLIVPLPEWKSGPSSRLVQNALHFPGFALLLVVIHGLLRRVRPDARRSRSLLVAALLTISLGAAGEWVQLFTARTASWEDFRVNILGVAAGSAAVVGAWLRGEPQSGRWRLTIIAVWVITISVVARPLAVALRAGRHQSDSFPRLGDFEEDWEHIFWLPQGEDGNRPTEATVRPAHATRGRYSLKIRAQGSTWSGVRLIMAEPLPWPTSRMLCFDIVNPGSGFDLGIRVDGIDGERFSGVVPVAPGANQCRVPPESLANRRRNLSEPRSFASKTIVFHLGARPARRTFHLDNVRLE